ncbi:hypothetical protein [Pantoea agglomerans]|uniref:hypothetical protein n=1 Tax=Enterobacter agglomerans TaxID=549 RepID=UPI002412F8D8|nr:hypothetical protein [Pantoea agglomerans]
MSIPISRNALLSELNRYNFVEVSEVVMFLQLICPTVPGGTHIRYMHEKLTECLENHDNGSDRFNRLRGIVGRLGEEMSAVSVSDSG